MEKKSLQQVVLGTLDSFMCIKETTTHPHIIHKTILSQKPAREIPSMTRSCEGDLTSKASGLEGLPGPIPPMTRSCGRDLTSKADQGSRDPLDLLKHLP